MSLRAEQLVQDYIYELKEPQSNLPRGMFEQRSYSIWAAEEILKAIKNDGTESSVAVVEDFIKKMDQFSRINPDTSRIFSIAYDISQDILDLLLDVLY